MTKLFDEEKFDIIEARHATEVKLHHYNPIVFGTSTWGRGMPPKPILNLRNSLGKIEGRRIGLYGSGRIEFEFFCGAVDLLEQVLETKNTIVFKFKYEGYPRDKDFDAMQQYIQLL